MRPASPARAHAHTTLSYPCVVDGHFLYFSRHEEEVPLCIVDSLTPEAEVARSFLVESLNQCGRFEDPRAEQGEPRVLMSVNLTWRIGAALS